MIITEVKECRTQQSSVMTPAVTTYLHNHVNEYITNHHLCDHWMDTGQSMQLVMEGTAYVKSSAMGTMCTIACYQIAIMC